jgi:probable HAF family extracellular repeat protein
MHRPSECPDEDFTTDFFASSRPQFLDKASEGQHPERVMERLELDAPDHRAILCTPIGGEMKSIVLSSTAALSLLAAVIVPIRLGAQPRYTVKDLGVLGSGDNASGFGINNRGWVAGASNLTPGGPQHAFVWKGSGPLIDLGTLGGTACPTCNSGASVPNEAGEVELGSDTAALDPLGEDFGFDHTGHQVLPAIWKHGNLTTLRPLPGGNNANAFGLNNRGQVIGFSENGVHDVTCLQGMPKQVTQFQAVIWEPDGTPKQLPPLLGDTVSFGFGINNKGQAVGSSGLCSNVVLPPGLMGPFGPHAVLWEADSKTAIDIGYPEATVNLGNSINNRGDVVGGSIFPDGAGATWMWSKRTGRQRLPTLPEAFFALAPCCNTINDSGQITGFSVDANGPSAVVWLDQKIYNLNSLVPADANAGLYFLFGQSINEAGEITGQGCVLPDCKVLHAFVATPSQGLAAGEVSSPEAQPVTRPFTGEEGRKVLQQWLGFGWFGARANGPR